MPLRFESNAGQWPEDVHFVAHQGSTQLTLRTSGAMLASGGTALRLTPAGGRSVRPVPSDLLETKSNFFLGDDPTKYRTDVPNYGTVTYPDVLDGVDLVYRGEEGQIEYDFVVRSGAAVGSVAMNVEGAESLSLTQGGDLLVQTEGGPMVQSRPRVFQREADGTRVDVPATYRIVGERAVGFEVAAYDRTKDLVIDPTLAYSAFLSGTGGDQANAVAAGTDGSAYVAGQATTTFPTTVGSYQPTVSAGTDAYVAKLKADNTGLAYATYLGGSGTDVARGIAVDANGNAYVVGSVTAAGTFPVQAPFLKDSPATGEDVFLVKLGPAGNTRVYSTLIGGAGTDRGHAIAIDATGNAYITGVTASGGYWATNGAIGQQQLANDAFVSKVNPTGSAFVFSSYLGGSGNETGLGIAVDSMLRPVVVGSTSNAAFPPVLPIKGACVAGGEGFVARFNADATLLDRSTCYGGSLDDVIRGVAIDDRDRLFIVGDTLSTDLDVTIASPPGAGRDMFVARLDLDGQTTEYARYLAGDGADNATGIATDGTGTAYVTGSTASTNFPLQYPLQPRSTNTDVVVARIGSDGNLLYSTLLGQTNNEIGNAIAVGPGSVAYVVGQSGTGNVGLQTPSTAAPIGTRNGVDSFFFKLSTPGPTVTALPEGPIPPKGTTQLTFAGNGTLGSTLSTNASGATYVPATRVYTAGSLGSVTDKVTVTDGEGGSRIFDIEVGPGVSITPAAAVVTPNDSLDFEAAGGSGTGYTWSIVTNVSGGSIVAATGLYTAGPTSGTDLIKAVDSLGNETTLQVAVGSGMAVDPATPTTPPRGAVSFTAVGGSGTGFVWSLVTAPSGGTITPQGEYVAGSVGSVVDQVKVRDSLQNERVVDVAVGPGVSITPASSTVTGGTAIAFSAAGGNGIYTWSSQALPSSGSIDAESGLYSAGVTALTVTDILVATDTLGNRAVATVQVTGTSQVPDAGSSSSGGSSSSSSSSSSGSSGNASSSSSSSGGASSTSSGASTNGSTSSSGDAPAESGDDGGGCSAAPATGVGSGATSLLFGLGMLALLRRRSSRFA